MNHQKQIIKKLNEIKNFSFKEKCRIFKEIFKIENGLFKSKTSLNNFIEMLLNLLEDRDNEIIKNESFSKIDNYEEIFYLIHFEKGFDKELGISKFHYGNKELAKKWKKNMMKKYHYDALINIDLDETRKVVLGQNINKIFKRMVGES
ncbi:hypothetical protein [Cetobacterium sp.]|uniref:hypothetical protein n=1 Tax=Cetobacterium sp. TaxID=2071632 RepID=UPI003F3A7525